MADSSYSSYLRDDGDDDLDDSRGRTDPELREQDRFLPIANVAKIMRKGIPAQGKIAKEAKECCQECVSEFISFITSEASDRCAQEKRKTINGEDILYAMSALGFDNYVEPLKSFLQKYRESSKMDKSMPGSEMEMSAAAYGGTLLAPDVTSGHVVYTNVTGTPFPGQVYMTNPTMDPE